MIVVHDSFICKPGYASKLAKKFKEAMSSFPEFVQVMTDSIGQFNKVLLVMQFESLAEYEKSYEKYKTQSEEIKKALQVMEGYQDMYMTGSREIFQVW